MNVICKVSWGLGKFTCNVLHNHSVNKLENKSVNFSCFHSQVLRFFCDSCGVPICRECSLGRHAGHSFTYLQEALQDSRALTIQLLADAQQGRQAVQVSEQLQSLINRHQHKHLLGILTYFFIYPSRCFTWTLVCSTRCNKTSTDFIFLTLNNKSNKDGQ